MRKMQINNREFYRKLARLALPIAFQSLMLSAVAASDALMLRRVAQNEMTAVSLASQVQFVQNMFLMSVTAAGSILGAQYWGKGDRNTVQTLFGEDATTRAYGTAASAMIHVPAKPATPNTAGAPFRSDASDAVSAAEY